MASLGGFVVCGAHQDKDSEGVERHVQVLYHAGMRSWALKVEQVSMAKLLPCPTKPMSLQGALREFESITGLKAPTVVVFDLAGHVVITSASKTQKISAAVQLMLGQRYRAVSSSGRRLCDFTVLTDGTEANQLAESHKHTIDGKPATLEVAGLVAQGGWPSVFRMDGHEQVWATDDVLGLAEKLAGQQ